MDIKFLQQLLEKITAAQKEGAELILHAHGIMTEMKSGHRDLVTDYDRRVQELLVARLRAAIPEASFFCEENSVQDALDGEHVFIIDPIDGTMNFVRSMHHSCIAVAYASRGEVLLASVYNPYFDELFTAIKGHGACLNARPIHAESGPLSETVFCMGSSPYKPELTEESFRLARIAMEASLDLRRFASAELDLCYVAAGRAGLYFELELSTWDYAAGKLIVEEAGGRCCTISGGSIPLDGSKPSVLAGGVQAVEDFLALIKKRIEMDLSLSRAAPVIFKEAVPSTNTVLKQLVPQSPPEGLVLAAKRQLSGRGRLGRGFESPEGGLYLSMLLYPRCAPEMLGTLTPCAAVAVRRAIRRVCCLDCGIKWPNDLQYEGKKLCGILTESSTFRLKTFVVLGIGINVNTSPDDFPPELRKSAASLSSVLGHELSIEALAAALIEELDTVYARWQMQPDAFLEEYREGCINVGKDVLLIENGISRPAFVTGIDESYALVVESEQGEEHIRTGEISLREK